MDQKFVCCLFFFFPFSFFLLFESYLQKNKSPLTSAVNMDNLLYREPYAICIRVLLFSYLSGENKARKAGNSISAFWRKLIFSILQISAQKRRRLGCHERMSGISANLASQLLSAHSFPADTGKSQWDLGMQVMLHREGCLQQQL